MSKRSTRETYASGTRWEPIFGYSRMVRVGDRLWVSGTTATGANSRIVGRGNAYRQAKQAFANIGAALERAGATFADVVRTRIFVVNIARDWKSVARVHAEIFGEIRPAISMVEVRALIDPDMLIEIEVDAVVKRRTRRRTPTARARR